MDDIAMRQAADLLIAAAQDETTGWVALTNEQVASLFVASVAFTAIRGKMKPTDVAALITDEKWPDDIKEQA